MTESVATECSFHPLRRQELVGRFDGGAITSDAGGLLLRELKPKTESLQRFSACFTDHRDPDLIEHWVGTRHAARVRAVPRLLRRLRL